MMFLQRAGDRNDIVFDCCTSLYTSLGNSAITVIVPTMYCDCVYKVIGAQLYVYTILTVMNAVDQTGY